LKYYFAALISVLVMILFYFAIIPSLNFLFLSTKEAKDLKDALIKDDFIPEDSDIQKIVSHDMLITAWDLNNRSPRFFTKKNAEKYKDDPKFKHDLKLSQMTWASANTPYYFKPAVIENSTYISGDNMAISPALFSYYYANEQLEKKQEDIRIVSIGATNELSEKIETKASLLDWAVRLTSLNAPVKKHTMDYMVQHLLAMNGHELHKFEIDKTRTWETDFYNTATRLPTLKDLASQFIFNDRDEIE